MTAWVTPGQDWDESGCDAQRAGAGPRWSPKLGGPPAVHRILVRIGVSQDMAALLLYDFRDAVAHFDKHPVTVSMTKEDSGEFSQR
jgi:hypothetical protein